MGIPPSVDKMTIAATVMVIDLHVGILEGDPPLGLAPSNVRRDCSRYDS
jgi:hypothetical protein